MTEILMMTLTPQIRKIAIKKRASHPSSIREPDLDFRKLLDKLEQGKITMKLEETENLKLQYVNRIETNTTHINNIQESDTDLIEKITEILNIYQKHPNFKGKPSFKKWCNYCRRYGHSISECRQKQQDNQNRPQKHKEPNKSFYQYMKKDQNLPNKNKYGNNSSGKPLPNNTNYTSNQSPYNSSYRGRSPERRNTQNSSQINYNRSNSRNNYSRSNSNATQFVSISSSQSNPRNNYFSNNQSRNSSYNRNRNYSHNRNRSYSNNRNQNYPNNRSKNNSYNRSNYHGSNNSQNRNSSYNNRYRNYSQSPHRSNNHYHNSKHRYRSSTPKHQRHINQVQTNEEITSDPTGIDDTGSNELQLNHINCGSSDTESDTENTISVNMITVENDYEPIIYEQPFTSHIYENQLELLHNYYIGPTDTTQTAQEVNEINTVIKPDEKGKTQCSNTNHIYQNIQKKQPREKLWTIPFLLESPRNKEFQPPDLEIDFLIDSGAESNIINIPTWNEIKTLHPKLTPLATSSKLATAQGSTIVNYGKIQLFLLPTRTMEQNKILNRPFKQIFHITDIKQKKIIGIPFISKNIPTINILNCKILIKDKYTKTKNTALTIFQRLNKQPPFFSKFYPISNQQPKHLKPLSGNIYNFSIKQVHQNDKKQNKQQLFMSDFEFIPIHKFFKITISSIKYLKNTNSDIILLHVYNNTPYQVTLPLGLLGYCETNATISRIHEVAYRVNNILQLLDICQSTILDEELSINNIVSIQKRNTDYFTKTPYFKPTFNITNYTKEQQKFLTMFDFEHSQIRQIEFDKLAKQLLKYSTVYATSKFDIGKISSSLHLPLKPDAVFKNKELVKYHHLHDKVNRLLDILEQYKNISPVIKEEQPKGNIFINSVIILAKGESLKIVLDARYLNSLIDESKCNWPIEPIQVILTKINGKYFTTTDMNSAYNQMSLDEQSRRLTQVVIGNQQYDFNRLFYGISIGPAAFSAFMSKIFRPLILKKNAITYLDDVFMQSQTKEEMFTVLEHYHKIIQNENLKAAPDKSHFFLTRVKLLGHNIERNTITPLKSRIDAIQKLQPPTNKKKIQEFLGMLNF